MDQHFQDWFVGQLELMGPGYRQTFVRSLKLEPDAVAKLISDNIGSWVVACANETGKPVSFNPKSSPQEFLRDLQNYFAQEMAAIPQETDGDKDFFRTVNGLIEVEIEGEGSTQIRAGDQTLVVAVITADGIIGGPDGSKDELFIPDIRDVPYELVSFNKNHGCTKVVVRRKKKILQSATATP